MTPNACEITGLVHRLERAIEETTRNSRSQARVFMGFGVLGAAYLAVQQAWCLLPVWLLFALIAWFQGRTAVQNAAPEKTAPVLEALRSAPGRVKKISHRSLVDSEGNFHGDWVEVISDEGRIYIRADVDWHSLLDALARRCPQAVLERGE